MHSAAPPSLADTKNSKPHPPPAFYPCRTPPLAGFVAKYTPVKAAKKDPAAGGSVQFVLHTGDGLRFKSTNVDWLTVAGAKATVEVGV